MKPGNPAHLQIQRKTRDTAAVRHTKIIAYRFTLLRRWIIRIDQPP